MTSMQACPRMRMVLHACGSAMLIVWLASNVPVRAGGPDARAQAEIAHLLTYLDESGCEFYRNGEWHAGRDASTHLAKTYESLRNKG